MFFTFFLPCQGRKRTPAVLMALLHLGKPARDTLWQWPVFEDSVASKDPDNISESRFPITEVCHLQSDNPAEI